MPWYIRVLEIKGESIYGLKVRIFTVFLGLKVRVFTVLSTSYGERY
jgi:hypothetical protein